MMKKQIIETTDEFNLFSKKPKLFANEIFLSLDIFDAHKNNKYSKIINENKNACGCETGTVFMVFSIVVGLSWIITDYSSFDNRFFINILYFILFVFLFSIVGKLVGLTIARLKLDLTLKDIKKNITQYGIAKMGAEGSN